MIARRLIYNFLHVSNGTQHYFLPSPRVTPERKERISKNGMSTQKKRYVVQCERSCMPQIEHGKQKIGRNRHFRKGDKP